MDGIPFLGSTLEMAVIKDGGNRIIHTGYEVTGYTEGNEIHWQFESLGAAVSGAESKGLRLVSVIWTGTYREWWFGK